MNIKTIVVRAAERVQRLFRVVRCVGALLASPAAEKRGKTATIASLHVADAGEQAVWEAP